jgi:hypothetical protein
MLAKLFNSPAKVKLIQFFLSTPGIITSLSDTTKKTRLSHATVRSACQQLKKLGIVKKETEVKLVGKAQKEKKYTGYTIDIEFPLYQEIYALFMKSQLLYEGDLVDKIKRIGGAMLIVLTGVFTGAEDMTSTDLLIVGKVNRDKLSKTIFTFEKKLGFEINYTVMTRSEYFYRKDITDRFLYAILEGKHLIILDKVYGKR